MATIIIAGFPGIGKTEYVKKGKGSVADLEPSPFRYNWDQATNWPSNYLDAIRNAARQSELVCIASYPEIIDVLTAEGFSVVVVYPDKSQRDEYKRRYTARKNDPGIVHRLDSVFESNIDNLMVLLGCRHIMLRPYQYLSDVIEQIL